MLLNFYQVSLLFILFFLGLSWWQKKQETIVRALTLLILLHILCLVIWQGIFAFTILITLVLSLSIYEVSQSYRTPYFTLIFFALGLFILGFYSDSSWLQIAIIWLIFITWITFTHRKKTIKSTTYLYLLTSGFLVPSAVFLIKIFFINEGAIVSLFFLLQLNDAFSYLFGKKLGRTYLFPKLSPNKTLEGYLFGGVGIILGIVLLHTYIGVLNGHTLSQDFILFLTILICGNLGDLILSSLKRKLEIKDFSNILPGHGGILDRFDNVFFIAPIFYVLLYNNLIIN